MRGYQVVRKSNGQVLAMAEYTPAGFSKMTTLAVTFAQAGIGTILLQRLRDDWTPETIVKMTGSVPR